MRGSLHPASLLTALVANLYGVHGPLSAILGTALARLGARPAFISRATWARSISARCPFWRSGRPRRRPALGCSTGRCGFSSPSLLVMAIYAFGKYTPVFAALFDVPGANLFRRPADATFPLCVFAGVIGGYCVSRFIDAPPDSRARNIGPGAGRRALCRRRRRRLRQGASGRRAGAARPFPLFCAALSLAALLGARRWRERPALGLLLVGVVADLRPVAEQRAQPVHRRCRRRPMTCCARTRRTKPSPSSSRSWRKTPRAGPARPGGAGGHRLPMAERRAGPWLRHGPRLQSDPADAFRRRDPRQRPCRACPSSACSRRPSRPTSRRWPICSACAGSRPACPPSRSTTSLKPGDLPLVRQTADAYIYENTERLPRVLVPGRAIAADFAKIIAEGGMPDIDYRRFVLLDRADCEAKPELHCAADVAAASPAAPRRASAKILRYDNTLVDIEADRAGAGRLPRAQRRLAELAGGLCRRPAGADPARQSDVPRGAPRPGTASRALPLRADPGSGVILASGMEKPK